MKESDDLLELRSRLAHLEAELSEVRNRLLPARAKFELPSNFSIVAFQLAGQPFGIFLPAVMEIVRMVKLAPMAGAPPAVAGLMNLRGAVLPVLDLRRLLDLPATSYRVNTPIILLDDTRQRRGFIVDSITEVRNVTADELEAPSSLMPKIEYFLAIMRAEQQITAILDHTRLMKLEDELFLSALISQNGNNSVE